MKYIFPIAIALLLVGIGSLSLSAFSQGSMNKDQGANNQRTKIKESADQGTKSNDQRTKIKESMNKKQEINEQNSEINGTQPTETMVVNNVPATVEQANLVNPKGHVVAEFCFERGPGERNYRLYLQFSDGSSHGKSLNHILLKNTCLRIAKVLDDAVILKRDGGDGLAYTADYYRYHADDETFERLYKERSWEIMEGGKDYTVRVWAREQSYFIQKQAGNQSGSVYGERSENVVKRSFLLEPDEGELVFEAASPVSFDPLSSQNLRDYQQGLHFTLNGKDRFLAWE